MTVPHHWSMYLDGSLVGNFATSADAEVAAGDGKAVIVPIGDAAHDSNGSLLLVEEASLSEDEWEAVLRDFEKPVDSGHETCLFCGAKLSSFSCWHCRDGG